MDKGQLIQYILLFYLSWFWFPFFSQFEEKFEEINAIEAPPSIPSTLGVNENVASTSGAKEGVGNEIEQKAQEDNRICSDIGTSQDFVSGIMKIVPDVDVSPYFCYILFIYFLAWLSRQGPLKYVKL